MIDPTADFSATASAHSDTPARMLLLCPPSLASHPAALDTALAPYDRARTDIQMLDRLALGLVPLPANAYGSATVVSDIAAHIQARDEAHDAFAQPAALRTIFAALTPGAALQSHGLVSAGAKPEEALGKAGTAQAILAGFVIEDGRVVKPLPEAGAAVPLRRKKPGEANGSAVTDSANAEPAPAGVGFVNGADDAVMVDEDDDALIDEDTLLDEADLASNITQRVFPLP